MTLGQDHDTPLGDGQQICDTVNMVIFAGGKFPEHFGKTFHKGVIFMVLLLFL